MNERLNDLWLRTMASTPQPNISTNFDQRLTNRIYQGRLNARHRWVVWSYTAASIVVGVWSMRIESIPWLLIVVSALLPLVLMAIVLGDIRRAQQSLLHRMGTLTGLKNRRTKP
jgi:hypothetical protein